MHVSEARVAANRLNALKSSGPKTPEGKDQSRRNALKHGLSGEGVVVSDEDREEIARRARALTSELGAKSSTGTIMVLKMATLSVRSERAAGREAAAVATQVRGAVDRHDEARVDQAAALFATLADDPRTNLRRLKKRPEGVDRLIDAWYDLRDDLAVGDWDEPQRDLVAHLSGERASVARLRPLGALALVLSGDFTGRAKADVGDLDAEGRPTWAVARMNERIAAEIAALEAHRETFDFETIELDRLDAPALALFDPSKEATLARRYEAAADRGFYQALKELRRSEAEFAAKAEAAGPPMSQPPTGSDPRMGSFGPPAGPGGFDPAPFDRPLPGEPARDDEGRPLVRNTPPVAR